MSLRSVAAALALAASTATPAAAQEPAPAAAVEVVHAGALLDRPGRQPRGNSSIIIRDGRIAEVQDGFVTPPPGAEVIDLRDRFVMPGFIDAHVHFATAWEGSDSRVTDSEPMSAYRALRNAQLTLRTGFTTVRNIGDGSGATMALRDAIDRGWVWGPRIIDAGRAVVPTYGHGDSRVGMSNEEAEAADLSSVCDGADECRKAVRLQIGRGADVIKIVTTGLSSREVGPDIGAQMTSEEIAAIVEVAHQNGIKVAAHAHGGLGLRRALEAGVDSIEHGTLMYQDEDDIAMLRRSGAFYVPTLATVTNYQDRLRDEDLTPEWRAITEARIAQTGLSVERAFRAGVPIVLGTDAGFSRHGDNALEFVLLSQHGLSPMDAIVAGTTNAARLLGVEDEVGSIEPGKSADIVAVRGNPLENIELLRSVGFVMREGVVYRND